jgi:transcriptional regulator with XRE-family HTH domain
MRRKTRNNAVASKLIDYLIEKRSMSQTQIAEVLSVDKSFVSRVRTAERDLSTHQLRQLADHLGVPLGALLIQAMPRPAKMNPDLAEIASLCERLMHLADQASAEAKSKILSSRTSKQSA